MSQPWIFICPSTRGISNALLNHILATTHPSIPILCTHRPSSSPPQFRSLPPASSNDRHNRRRVIHTLPLDVTVPETISEAASRASELFPPETHHLHLAFTLPGILLEPERSIRQISPSSSLETFRTNALGPLLLIKHFGPFLPSKHTTTTTILDYNTSKNNNNNDEYDDNDIDNNSNNNNNNKNKNETRPRLTLPPQAIWTSASARVGSISDNKLGGWYAYRASKAALNSVIKTFDVELERRSGSRAMAVAYHPGTVKTDLTRDYWDGPAKKNMLSPEEAAERMANVITGLDLTQRGRCWDWKGEEVLP